MNIMLDIIFYIVIAIGVIGISLGFWLLCTKSGKKYWSDYCKELKEYDERKNKDIKDIEAKGG